MNTFSNGKVTKNPITGRFMSVKAMKLVHTIENKEPKAPKAPKAEAPKVEGPIVEILSALYGIEGNRITVTPVIGKKMTNKIAGSDPAPKVKKDVIVTARVNGEEVVKTFTEGEIVTF